MYSITALSFQKREKMNNSLLLSLVAATLLTSSLNADSMYKRVQSIELKMKQMQNEIATLKAEKSAALQSEKEAEEDDDEESIADQISDIQENLTDLNKATNGSHLKFNTDYRFAIDTMQYKMADGSKQGNHAFMTNRLWISSMWKATNNLSFTAQLAYNKAFGTRSGLQATNQMETFDWITNENAYDGTLRVRSAYFLYINNTFLSADIPWTFSIGRRPSTNGHLVNLREDDYDASTIRHIINVEFDGLSLKFGLKDLTDIDGMYIKFCAGRGLTNATAKFSSTPYATNNTHIPDINLGGFIFVPYNDGQYAIATQYYYVNNLIDVNSPTNPTAGFTTVGGMHSVTANLTINGIGNEWSDYLDDTFFFISGAISKTNPRKDKGMLGSKPGESKTGYSFWAGLQMPSFISEEGRWGVEYNKGSAYWRSITYGEDTNIGSKLAARGNAYEAYFTEPIIEDILSLQVRYTYIDYKWTGSNGFFGNTTGNSNLIETLTPMQGSSATVDKAQEIRFYIRYRY